MSDIRVLILPGRGGSGPDHWQSHWEAAYPDYIRVQQREWDNPTRDEWVETLQTAIAQSDAPTVLVAHSLSVSLVVHWAQKYGAQQPNVQGALLVAPSDVERWDYPVGTQGFAPIPLLQLPFKSIVIASEDDPRVTLERATDLAHAWGSKLELAGKLGHMGSASLLEKWPFGFQHLQILIDDAVVTQS